MDRKDLPVWVEDNELPRDDTAKYREIDDNRATISGGFVDAIFLGAIMVVCFMWGMLVVILR